MTTAVFESPHRLIKTLQTIEDIFGEDHEIYLGFELTKLHERHLRNKVKNIRL